MGSLPPADTAVQGSEILLRVGDWLHDNQDRPCIAMPSEEFRTPLAAWEDGGDFSPLEDLRFIPDRILEHPHLFLSGWAGVQEATGYILTSPLSSSVVARSHVDASEAGFVFRLSNGQYGAILPGELGHTPLEDLNLRRQEEPGPPLPPAGMEGGALEGANLHRSSDYGTRTWHRPGSYPYSSSFTVDAVVITDTHSTGPEVNFWKAQVRQCLGPDARLFSADSHRLPSRRPDSDRVAVGGCMIIINDAWGSKAHHWGTDGTHLGIVIWTKIRTGRVGTLLIGAYWPVHHKANSPETCGALGHRIQLYLTKMGNQARDSVEYMQRECARLAMNHLAAQPTAPIILMGDFNKTEDQLRQWLHDGGWTSPLHNLSNRDPSLKTF